MGLSQNTKHLNTKQVKRIMENRGVKADGTEYCMVALQERLAELNSRNVTIDVVAEYNSFMPPLVPRKYVAKTSEIKIKGITKFNLDMSKIKASEFLPIDYKSKSKISFKLVC